jgi:hypothetical protein
LPTSRTQREAERKAEFIDSAFDAAREDDAEYKALVAALDRRGYADLVARALRRELERDDLSEDARTRAELSLAEVLGKKLSLTDEAVTVALATLSRVENQKNAVGRAAESISALLKELGQLPKLYQSLLVSAERDTPNARHYFARCRVGRAQLKDDALAVTRSSVLAAWGEGASAAQQDRADVLARLDEIVSRLVEAGGPPERLANVLESIVDFVTAQGGSFAAVAETLYRLLALRTAAGEHDAAHALLERAARDDADGDRLEAAIRAAMTASAADGSRERHRFVRCSGSRSRAQRPRGGRRAQTLAGAENDPIHP